MSELGDFRAGATSAAIIDGIRTPFAKAFTQLQSLTAVELGVHAVSALLAKSSQAPEVIDEAIFGNVAGQPDAANLARVIALRAGVPQSRIAHTVSRNCASGMESIVAAWHAVRDRRRDDGSAPLIVAGGTESMSNIPMLVSPEAAELWMRLGRAKTFRDRLAALAAFRPHHFKPRVGIEMGLTDPVCGLNMGCTAEVLAEEFSITRQEQDVYALTSHQRAVAARDRLAEEIAPVTLASAGDRGTEQQIAADNGPRENQTIEQLAKLRPLFKRGDGTVTAGNSCPLTDGAAALLITDAERAESLNVQPLGYLTAYAIAGCDPRRMGLGPVYAIAKLLRSTGLTLDDFELIELNEAFAVQVLSCRRAAESATFARDELGLDHPLGKLDFERTNVNGGAIALGHPVGTSGTRLVLTVLHELRRRGLRRGLAALCVGGGQGMAMMVQTEREMSDGNR